MLIQLRIEKLGRVGQEYHRGKGRKEEQPTNKKSQPQSSSVQGKKALADALESYWDIEEWDDKTDKNFTKKIKDVVKNHNISEKEFKAAAHDFREEFDIDELWDEVKKKGSDLQKAIEEGLANGELEMIEKAVYADTPQNRKLGRVGQEYKKGKGDDDNSDKKPQPKLSREEHVKNLHKIFDDYEGHGNDEKLKKDVNAYTRKHNIGHHDFNGMMDGERHLRDYALRQSARHKSVAGEDAWDAMEKTHRHFERRM